MNKILAIPFQHDQKPCFIVENDKELSLKKPVKMEQF